MQMTVGNVYQVIDKMSGHSLNAKEDVITFGTATGTVTKIQVCWMADLAAIQHATGAGADLIIAHESLFFPYLVGYR